jgi:hypothetical protein
LLSQNRVAARRAANLARSRAGADVVPISVVDVASRFADIEREDWPVNSVDGITINCSARRPQIFYRGDPSALRTRFTIAHELGHAVLPWHVGTMECEMPKDSRMRSPDEQEADHFASELLLPSDWLKSIIISRGANLDLVLSDIVSAQASATASMIALATVLPIGWALQLNNQDVVLAHDYGRKLTRKDADALASASGKVDVHQQVIRWWRLFDVPALPEMPTDKREASALFDIAWLDTGDSQTAQKRLDGRVSGLLGHSADVLDLRTGFGYLLWRLRESHEGISEDANFRGWLAWKAAQRLEHA